MTIATQMLLKVTGADAQEGALCEERLLLLVYEQLRDEAGRLLGGERRAHTLQPTALVHEAYLKLIDGARIDVHGRTHFFRLAARAMRRVLVEHARKRLARKRGGQGQRIALSTSVALDGGPSLDVLDLDDALERLAQARERASRVVELRHFGGMTIAEAAAALDVSERTVVAEWTYAQAWLRRELREKEAEA
ncbi:MAG: ECF-type sigma factor [Planctomycetota bacterium]